ncbi:arginyltransferase [Aliamphritea hakodatensis]|uniref:arginyltransferase n=1 Tax=Aliamphritea hakodatensis TaxID=2895352 RepID=UPI0022FD6D81|nr:arginyltransferase [Aliamphritea hakodatensis]
MTNLKTLHFYTTPEHECSYLDGVQAKTLFVDPHEIIATDAYSQLSDLGFRRSGKHIYRPYCNHCQACISVRIPVREFHRSKSQQRIWNRNSDLLISQSAPRFTDEYYDLYARYIEARHSDGDMYPPSQSQFSTFLVESQQQGCFIEFRLPDKQLIGIAVIDDLIQGLSAIYTFFDPQQTRRSLGSYAILWQIEEVLRQDKDYLYLGYWVRDCQKMSYKTSFRPLEMLLQGEWLNVDV